MAYNEELAGRIETALASTKGISAKEMFGGVCFLQQGKMLCGIVGDDLMIRVDPARENEFLKMPHVRPMDFTGRPMKGFYYVAPAGVLTDSKLNSWLSHCLDYLRTVKTTKPRKSPKK